jgi:hypothetical protein
MYLDPTGLAPRHWTQLLHQHTITVVLCLPSSRITKRALAKWCLFEIVHDEALYAFWLQRCRAVFDDASYAAESIAELLRSRIRLAMEAARHLRRIDGFQDLSNAIH